MFSADVLHEPQLLEAPSFVPSIVAVFTNDQHCPPCCSPMTVSPLFSANLAHWLGVLPGELLPEPKLVGGTPPVPRAEGSRNAAWFASE